VQLSTRSGINSIHGSAYECLRNTVLNAKNYFQQTIPPFKLSKFGGTVGRPIIKDRTFFFFAAEDLQQRSSPNPISIQVPTAGELGGDFSGLLAKHIALLTRRPALHTLATSFLRRWILRTQRTGIPRQLPLCRRERMDRSPAPIRREFFNLV
jgi:hypothetical protein